DVVGESAALRQLAIASWFKNDVVRYRALVEDALQRAETLGPSVERCWALAYKSQMEMLLRAATATRQPAAAMGAPIEWAERALERGDVARAQERLDHSFEMTVANEKQSTWTRLLAVAVAAESGPDATRAALDELRASLAASGPDYYDQWSERESTAVLEAI